MCDTPIHKINVAAANEQAATALDSRVKNLNLSPYRHNFHFNLLIFVINLIFQINYKN